MRLGHAFILVVLFMQLCSSCMIKPQMNLRTIRELETKIDTSADSILNIISKTSPSTLKGSKVKARFHLLYSIALDKSGIDIKSDSIISPALKYYLRKPESHHKLQTLYYTARVQENIEDYAAAMEYLAQAETMLDQSKDPKIAALIYASKGRIYTRMLEYNQAEANFNKAASEYLKSGDENRYIANMLRAADCMLMSGINDKACRIIAEIEKDFSGLSQSNLNKLFILKLKASEVNNPESTETILAEYLSSITNPSVTDWLFAARIYIDKGKAEEAFTALDMQRKHKGINATFHYLMALAFKLDSRYEESLEEFMKYTRLSGTIGKNILSQDTRFVEERFRQQRVLEKEKNKRIVFSLASVIIFLAFALAAATTGSIRRELKIRKLEEDSLRRQIDELMLEREELVTLEQENREGRKIIKDRLRIIDQFVMSDAFNDSIFESNAAATLKEIISDRVEFVRQNRLIFNQSSPKFIAYLTGKGLSDIEIDHCCLYAIGMNGKMVTTFTNAKRHYHIGSDVRKKLGLNIHDTNISIYIRNLHHQMQG